MPTEEEMQEGMRNLKLHNTPIPGKPRYNLGDMVNFVWDTDCIKNGKIYIVDAYGTFEQNLEPSYDILVEEENCIYKHICESELRDTSVAFDASKTPIK